MSIKTVTALALVVSSSFLAACLAPSDDGESGDEALSRPNLTARFADLRKVNTENLARLGVNLGAEAANKALSIHSRYADLGIQVEPTNVFGAQAEDNPIVPADGKVKSLADIHNGLASDYGDKEFPTELAKVRLAHLAQGDDKYYVETGFGMSGALGFGWSHPAGGFGPTGTLSVGVGFKKGEAFSAHVVVAAPDSSLQTLMDASGEAIQTMRGFVLPSKPEEIQAMKPGEMIGLRGKGTFAANFGLGVPILIANAGPFAYTIAVSAGLSHAAEGVLDVGLVRLDGDEVAVDVGITNASINAATVGVFGGWGINHNCEDGAACLDSTIGKIVQRGLLHELNGFMRTSIAGSQSTAENRLELARMRFHLSQPEVPEALQQALHGDLRYAQALYTKNLEQAKPPVSFDFDMMRASTTSSRSFGAQVFGISIYQRSSSDTTGQFAIQTPDGVQSVLWDSFQKKSGFFEMDSGSKLTAISSASLDASNPDKALNRANLVVQTVVGDKHMDDDMVLDSADALIAMLAGREALAPLDKYGNAMANALTATCGAPTPPNGNSDSEQRQTWNERCNVDLISDESKAVVSVDGASVSLVEARRRGVAAFSAQSNVARLPDDYKKLLATAAELRLTLSMVSFHAVSDNSNPKVSFALNYRLDDKALGMLAAADESKLQDAVKNYFATVSAARLGFSGASPLKDGDLDKAATAMAARLTTFKAQYGAIAANESQDLPSLLSGKPYVKLPIGIRFDVSDVAEANGADRMAKFIEDDKRIRVESISFQRAMLAKSLFDALVTAADKSVGFGNSKGRLFKEQAAGYALLGLLPAQNLEVGLDLGADVSSDFWHKRQRFTKAGFQAVTDSAHGKSVEAISDRMFNLDTMMSR